MIHLRTSINLGLDSDQGNTYGDGELTSFNTDVIVDVNGDSSSFVSIALFDDLVFV